MEYSRHANSFTLSWYILRAHVGPFIFSVTTLMFLFILQFVMKFMDQLVGKGLSGWVIMELVILNLAWMLVLAVPMSVLVAVLMAFGDLSSKNEITAMKASGVSIYRMMAPVLIAGTLIAFFVVWFNNYVLPESNHRLKTLTVDIRRKRPAPTLVNGVFMQDLPGYSILARKTFERSNDLEGVTLYDYTNPVRNVAITAEKGRISFSQDYRRLILDLENGEIHDLDLQAIAQYRRIRFLRHRITMDVEGFDFERSSESAFSRTDRELGARAMRLIVDSLRAAERQATAEFQTSARLDNRNILSGHPLPSGSAFPGEGVARDSVIIALNKARQLSGAASTVAFRVDMLERQIDQYLVEIHKKYSIPVACIVFVLVGVPLGIMSRRGGFGIAATLSLGFFVLYWTCLIGGEKLADRDILSPFLGMWMANILIGLVGVYLTVRTAKETLVINWNFFTRFVPKKWRSTTEEEASPAPVT
jgi:lipopolysaccharide export system permease protein